MHYEFKHLHEHTLHAPPEATKRDSMGRTTDPHMPLIQPYAAQPCGKRAQNRDPKNGVTKPYRFLATPKRYAPCRPQSENDPTIRTGFGSPCPKIAEASGNSLHQANDPPRPLCLNCSLKKHLALYHQHLTGAAKIAHKQYKFLFRISDHIIDWDVSGSLCCEIT